MAGKLAAAKAWSKLAVWLTRNGLPFSSARVPVRRDIAFLCDGIVNRACQQFSRLFQGDGNGIHGQSVDVVGGSIQRIDDPTQSVFLAGNGAVFFCQKSMAWKRVEQDLLNHFLRGQIGFGDQIGRAFLADRKPARPIEQYGAAGPGRLFANCFVF